MIMSPFRKPSTNQEQESTQITVTQDDEGEKMTLMKTILQRYSNNEKQQKAVRKLLVSILPMITLEQSRIKYSDASIGSDLASLVHYHVYRKTEEDLERPWDFTKFQKEVLIPNKVILLWKRLYN